MKIPGRAGHGTQAVIKKNPAKKKLKTRSLYTEARMENDKGTREIIQRSCGTTVAE